MFSSHTNGVSTVEMKSIAGTGFPSRAWNQMGDIHDIFVGADSIERGIR
jgi:hypothetical protein